MLWQNQQTKQALYQAKYGRFGVSDPFQALQRDSEDVADDNFDHAQVGSSPLKLSSEAHNLWAVIIISSNPVCLKMSV